MADTNSLGIPIPPEGGLTVELVPRTAWFTNVRTLLTSTEWNKCKQFVRRRSGDRCEICAGRGEKWPVECHEVWQYHDLPVFDHGVRTQYLAGLIALCPPCHQVKHLGFAATSGRLPAALDHLCQVNGWTLEEAELYATAAFAIWEGRSQFRWEVNITYLWQLGIDITKLREVKNG